MPIDMIAMPGLGNYYFLAYAIMKYTIMMTFSCDVKNICAYRYIGVKGLNMKEIVLHKDVVIFHAQ